MGQKGIVKPLWRNNGKLPWCRNVQACWCLSPAQHQRWWPWNIQRIASSSPRQIFNKYGLKITIESNKKIANFLDMTLNLSNGTYLTYTKPNNIPLYINKKPNYPPQIIKNIPLSINKRLSEISYDEASFNKIAPLYQKALDESGYKHCLKFSTPSA